MTPVGPKTQRHPQAPIPAQHQAPQENFAAEIAAVRRDAVAPEQGFQRWRPPRRARRSQIYFILLFLWTALYVFCGASSVVSFVELSQQSTNSNLPPAYLPTSAPPAQAHPATTAAGFSFIATLVILGWSPIGLPLLIATVATLPEPQ